MRVVAGARALAKVVAIVSLAAAALPAARATAAEVAASPPGSSCTLKLTGPIREGDAARFADAFQPLTALPVVNLCLSSPGGVVGEALGIIRQIRAAPGAVRTLVEAEGSCFSACALIFMSGRAAGPGGRPERRLHVAATLGFHAPSIRKPDGRFDADIMRQAHFQALRGMSQILSATDENAIPMELFARMLLARPTEFLLVDTVDRAGRWKIDLLGESPPAPTRKRLRQGCVNYLQWTSGMASEPNGGKDGPVVFQRDRHRATFPGFGDEASFTCVTDLFKARDGSIHLNIALAGDASEMRALDPGRLAAEVTSNRDPLRRVGAPLWHLAAPDVKLRDLIGAEPSRPRP